MAACNNPSVVNLDNAQRVDIVCRKGDTFSLEVDFFDANNDPIDLTGYAWKMDVSESDTSPTPILNDTDFVYNGTSTGNLYITATATVMATIDGGMYVYGLQSNDAGNIKTWLYGLFTVNEDVVE
jgi:hypothetical protein